MKTSIAVFAGIAIGFVAAIFLLPSFGYSDAGTKPLTASETEAVRAEEKQFLVQEAAGGATPINRQEAWNMFVAYHQSSDLAGSKGCLEITTKTANDVDTVQKLVSVFLPKASVLDPLMTAAQQQNEKFIGVAAFPAKKAPRSHTIIWVAVVEDENNEYGRLLLPDDDVSKDLIFDYTDVCPDMCEQDIERVWNRNWAE